MKTAAIYARISRDPDDTRAGVERQEEDCRALADRQGLNVVQVFVDNDISASTLSKKTRPAYSRMIEAAKAGEIDVIVAYSNSRLTRRLMDLEDLIRLHERYGTEIKTVVSGEDNLGTADGRMVARIKASVDAAEAEKAAERIQRAMLQRVHDGIPSDGPRVFGWQPDKIHLDPVEAALVREAAQRIMDGASRHSIAADWRARGIRTVPGGEWSHTAIGRILTKPRLAGIQTHRGKIVTDAVGEPLMGKWEPIMDRDEFDRLQVALQRGSRKGGMAPGHRKYLLSGIIRCGICGSRMYGVPARRAKTANAHGYQCQIEGADHTLGIAGRQTDELIIKLAKARMAAAKVDEVTVEHDEDADEVSVKERLAQIPALITELMDAFKAGDMPGSIVFPQVKLLETERAELQVKRDAQIKATSGPSVISVDDFDDLDMERQRAVLENLLDAVVIAPASRRGEPWTPARITPAWR